MKNSHYNLWPDHMPKPEQYKSNIKNKLLKIIVFFSNFHCRRTKIIMVIFLFLWIPSIFGKFVKVKESKFPGQAADEIVDPNNENSDGLGTRNQILGRVWVGLSWV